MFAEQAFRKLHNCPRAPFRFGLQARHIVGGIWAVTIQVHTAIKRAG